MLPLTNRTQENFNRHILLSRWIYFIIHFILYLSLLILIYVRLEQINTKQDKFFQLINITLPLNDHHHSSNHLDCSCPTYTYPKRNRTTHCLELHIGLNDILLNVFCPNENVLSWLVIQNRQSNEVNFNRTWNEYRRGFGHVGNRTNFWIGNENLYWLTNHYQCRLKIELTNSNNETRSAIYEHFRIGNQNENYRLQIDEYHGNIEGSNTMDSFSRWHHNAPFSTYDHYTTENLNCPQIHGGTGWWYHSGSECAHVHLNGLVATYPDGLVPLNRGILWIGWKFDRHYSFQHVQMSIQPKFKREKENKTPVI